MFLKQRVSQDQEKQDQAAQHRNLPKGAKDKE
jgi:hypothetical protein